MTFNSPLSKLTFLLPLLLLFGGILLVVSGETAASPQGEYLTAVQLTDHTLTGEDTGYFGSLSTAIGRNAAHVIWREQSSTNTGMELFYRSLPHGTTQRLSDNSVSINTTVIFPAIQLSATDTPHVIWEEYTTNSVDFRDIYYWNPKDGTSLLVSQTPTTGFNLFRPVIWLDGDDAHIVWQQRNAAQTDEIFMYWNSVSKTAVELPGFEAGLVHNGILHITWESSFNGPVNYWNSNDQMTVSLPGSTIVGDASVHQRGIFANTAGQITIFFGFHSLGDVATTCLASWNSSAQLTTIHIAGNKCFSVNQVQRDNQGVYHTFAVDSNSGFLPYYWNSTLANAVSFDVSGAGTGFGIPGGNLYLADTGKVHIVWKDNNDLFYWNPGDQQIINLSEASGPNTQIASYFMFPRFDSVGNLTLIWQEQAASASPMAPFYWESAEKITTNLETKLGMSDIVEQAITGDLVYRFYGVPIVGDAGAFYWNIEENSVTRVWTGGPTSTFFRYETGPGDEIITAWVEQTTDALTVNSTAKGNQIMNQTAADDTDNLVYILETDDFGNLYVIWTEMSDSSGEGVDFFAAWSTDFVEGTADVYLPFVTR